MEKVLSNSSSCINEEKSCNSTSSNDDDNTCCECGRTPDTIAKEKLCNDLLPYSKCDECDESFYLKPDPDHVEYDCDGDTVLAGHCENSEWQEALQRVKIFPSEANTHDCEFPSALYHSCKNGAPLCLILAIAQAAPETIVEKTYDDSPPLPLDCLLSETPKRGVLSKIKILLNHNIEAAALSVAIAWNAVRKSVGEGIDTDDNVFFLSKAKLEQHSKTCWEIFCFLKKVAHYKTVDVRQLPLLPALANCHYLYNNHRHADAPEEPALPLKLAIGIFPDQVKSVDEHGNTLLHLACSREKPERIKEDWEEDYWSDDDSDIFNEGKILNEMDGHNAEQIKILLSAFPKATRFKNQAGDLPIHVAIKARKKWNVLKILLDAYPESITEADGDGNTCLHLAVSIDPETRLQFMVEFEDIVEVIDIGLIKKIAEFCPKVKKVANKAGQFPLHVALEKKKCDSKGIKLLFSTFDEAKQKYTLHTSILKKSDNDGLLPLHIAAKKGARPNIFERVLTLYPAAAKTPDKQGRLPLHYTKEYSYCQDFLLKAYPDATKVRDNHGQLPLHMNGSEVLLKAYPDGIKVADNQGNLPVHTKENHNKLDRLLKAYPDAAKSAVKDGPFLLHLFLRRKEYKHHPIVDSIVKANPSALSIPDDDGLYPFALAANSFYGNTFATEGIFKLLSAAPEVLAHSLMIGQNEDRDDVKPPAKKKRKIDE